MDTLTIASMEDRYSIGLLGLVHSRIESHSASSMQYQRAAVCRSLHSRQ